MMLAYVTICLIPLAAWAATFRLRWGFSLNTVTAPHLIESHSRLALKLLDFSSVLKAMLLFYGMGWVFVVFVVVITYFLSIGG